jgi:hypothetical protein
MEPMKKIIGRLIVGLALPGLFAPAAVKQVASAQKKEAAVLTQPEGDVRVQRRRSTLTIKEDTLLNMNDTVRVYGDGTAVIYQPYTHVVRLSKKRPQFTVVPHFPPVPRGAVTPELFTALKQNQIAAQRNRSKPSPATMGGPEDAILTLLEPRNSVVLARRPTFTWSRVSNATKYVVSIYKKGDSPVCTESTSETRLALPGKCRPLNPGGYKWEVTAQVGKQVSDNSALYDATSFTVATRRRAAKINRTISKAQAIAANDSEAKLIYITALMKYELYPRAEAELLRALKLRPANQSLWALLMETYARMKRWRAREKARDISAGTPTVEMIHALELRR